MTVRVGKINGKNLNYLDHDVSSLDYALVNQGVIEGMNVTAGFVEVGRALIAVTRTNVTPHQKFLVHAEVTVREPVDTSGNKKIWLEVNKNFVNDGTLATNPNGTEIARIMTGSAYPNANSTFFIPLASISGGTITDERKFIGKKIPDIRGVNRRPKDYTAQSFYGPEFVQGSVVGISGANWVNLHTYNPWTSHVYATQTAISAYGALGVWIRKANSEDAWGEWQKIFPFSATALDFAGLPEVQNYSSVYDTFPFVMNGQNRKVTIENLSHWLVIPKNNKTNLNVSAGTAGGTIDGNNYRNYTNSVHVGKGLVFLHVGTQAYNIHSGAGATFGIEVSTDNQNWERFELFSTGNENKSRTIPLGTIFGRYIRAYVQRHKDTNSSSAATLTIFQ